MLTRNRSSILRLLDPKLCSDIDDGQFPECRGPIRGLQGIVERIKVGKPGVNVFRPRQRARAVILIGQFEAPLA